MTSSNVGPSEQAQPTNVPSAERVKSSSSGESAQAPTDSNKAPSPNKSISLSQTISSSQSGTLSGTSGTSSSSSAPNTSSSSGTTSSSGGYPPSSSHSSDSPEDHPPDNHRGNPGSDGDDGGRGDSSQPPPNGSSESTEQSNDKKDSSVGEGDMETNPSELDMSTAQERARQSSLDQTSQTEGTQDSFLKRKDNSSSLSSREGGESGYIGGSSSVSVLASVSPSKSTSGSLSGPLAAVSDSQETLESSVSCIEDSVPLPNTAQAQVTPNIHKSARVVAKNDTELNSNKLKLIAGSPDHVKKVEDNPETSEGEGYAAEVSSELLPLEPPHSLELLDDDVVDGGGGDDGKCDSTDSSPVIAFQGPEVPRDSNGTDTVESPVIALQSPLSSKKAISKPTQLVPMEVDLQEEPESSQAMDTDMISTQNSFILQLADSQCTLTPFSPFKQSQHKPVDSEGLSKDDSAVNRQDYEQTKNDLPGLTQENEVEDANNKQLHHNIGSRETDAGLEASKHEGDGASTVPVVSNEPVSEGDKLPLHSAVKSKPIPLYESLLCEDSSSQASINFAQTGTKETSKLISSNQRLGELQDTSQITNSGINGCFEM